MAATKTQKIPVDLYFDVISPYSWVAFEALLRYENIWNIKVNLKPFFLRDVMQAVGNKPPLTVPAKGMYMLKDLERNNSFWGMEMRPPVKFAKWIRNPATNTEKAQKLLLVVQHEKPELLESVTRAFWQRIWHEGEPIFEDADFEKVLHAAGIHNTAHFIGKLTCPKVAAELKANTDTAVDQGCFGAPWIVVHKDGEEHGFFGSDRFHLIAQLVGGRFTDGQTQYSKL